MATSGEKRRAGRPSSAVLNQERIINAAFDVAERAGGNFTIAGIARLLGVQPPAIYNYYPSKDAVIAGMRGQLTLRIGDHGFAERPWHEAIIPWARAYLEVLGRSPGTIAAIATHPVDSEPESITDYERIVQALLRDGAPSALIVPALVSLESFIIGSALDALAPDVNLRPERSPEVAPGLLFAEELARDAARDRGHSMSRNNFEFGLAALVAGIRAQFGEPMDAVE